ncbi:hypothetical protein E1B28_001910 [Marasmius oreades]|uniref:F-box domain-containing protein n=1 Tax=Marasmius oreades TaxID=181124 RepID=A0A9P7V4G7_9AGAR|nr:uncharacterized protein E1B28_001910 [Marasmius oreades]KAG7100130.1 hypothetical protein E1B28_001910 [Marasmius oreades]
MHSKTSREVSLRSSEIRNFFRTTVSKEVVTQFLCDIEIEVDRIQTDIYALENRRDRLKGMARLYRSLLSPIYTIPQEILTRIFTFCCQENVLSPLSAPEVIQISMVCGRWRDIVFSSPALWSSITIDFGEWHDQSDILDRLVNRFLRNSQEAPLHLLLDFPGVELGEPGEEVVVDAQAEPITTEAIDPQSHTLAKLVGVCERWREVSFAIVNEPFFSFDILRPVCGRLHALESLTLRVYDAMESESDWQKSFLELLDHCPSLRSLCISDPYLLEPGNMGFAWHKITTLHLLHGYNVQAFPVIALCREVERLELSAVGGLSHNDEDYMGHVDSERITSLAIKRMEGPEHLDDVLRHLTLKNLSSVKICGETEMDWITWDNCHFHDFLLRSGCAITSLHLQAFPVSDLQTISLLKMTPTLESLCIVESSGQCNNRIVTRRFLKAIAISTWFTSPSFVPPLPRLTRLKLVAQSNDIDPRCLLRLLSSRWLPKPIDAAEVGIECLRVVEIVVLTGLDDLKEKPLDCLRCFRNAGMRLSVTYGKASEFYEDGR